MEYQISHFLDEFLEQIGISVTELAKKLDISQPYVSYVKNGTKTASKKFIEKLVSTYPSLEGKKEKLLEMLENDKNMEKLQNIEKKKQEVLSNVEIMSPGGKKLTKRERIQLNEVIGSANYFFNDETVDFEDKEKLILTLHELFIDAKNKNKSKK